MLSVLIQAGIAALGVIVAWTAVQAYRRTGESVMGLVAAGFVLVSIHGLVEYVAENHLGYGPMAGEVIEVSFIGLGMLSFAYALFGPIRVGQDRRESSDGVE